MANDRIARRARAEVLDLPDTEDAASWSATQRATCESFARQSSTARVQFARVTMSDEIVSTVWREPETDADEFAREIFEACARDACDRPRGTRPAYVIVGFREDGQSVTNARLPLRGSAPHSQASPLDHVLGADTASLDPSPAGQVLQQMKHSERSMGLLVGGFGTVIATLRAENERLTTRIADLETKLNDAGERIHNFATQESAIRAETAMIEAKAKTTRELGSKLVAYAPMVLRHILGPIPKDGGAPANGAPTPAADGAARRKPVPSSVVAALKGITPDQLAKVRGKLTIDQAALVERAHAGEPIEVGSFLSFGELTEEAIEAVIESIDSDQMLALVGALDDWREAYDAAREADEAAEHAAKAANGAQA